MKHQFGALMGLVVAVSAAPQGVTNPIPPSGSAPSGCSSTYNGEFGFSVAAVGSNVASGQIACNSGTEGQLILTLNDGVLRDGQDRTGYIADNYQFQFDGPPQAGAIYTSGFSVCSNGSIALGPSTVFYQCLSGSFYNLYSRDWAPQCEPVHFVIQSCGNGQSQTAAPTAIAPPMVSQIQDGQIQAPPVASQISDGQVQAPTGVVSQIPDGQVQAPTGQPPVASQISDGQVQAPTAPAPPVSQISDGQVQAPTGQPPVASQISDGQVQAPTAPAAPPVASQISDGQVQAPTATAAPPVASQISDGQVQAPTAPAAPPPVASQISDGQVQAPTGVASQISDGQVQAPTGPPPAPPTPPVTQISDGQVQAPTGIATQISDGQIQAPTREDVVATPSSSVVPPSAGNKHLPGAAMSLSLSFLIVAFFL